MKIFIWLLASTFLYAETDFEQVFSEIYQLGPWDESGFVFSGSQIEISRDYVAFLQDFLKRHQIRSVVDVGCGDWAFSRYIDWSGIEYTGIDVVEFVVERNRRLFAAPRIHFVYGNALDMDLPDADLVICKDVFQHLSNEAILKMLKKFKKFKHCLITDFVDPRTLSSHNPDIETGEYHPVDLSKPPFNVNGEKVLRFKAVFMKQTFYIFQE